MIYFDNAATTYPKPDSVYKALDYANRNLAFNSGRGEYKESVTGFDIIEETRFKIANLVSTKASNVIFSSSATESLNQIINGMNISSGDTIYISPFEHNAVVRPLYLIKERKNIEIKILPFDKKTWLPEIDKIKSEFILNNPKAVFISHISNVTGYLVPYKDIFELAEKYGSVNVLDCSQSLGVINPKTENVNYIVFAGHKSLYASFGIAGFIKLRDDELEVVKSGGTGSDSLNHYMPEIIPYKYEAGSPNIVAVYGLNKAIEFIKQVDIYNHEKEIFEYLIQCLNELEGIHVYCPEDSSKCFGVVSINMDGYFSDELASILYDDFGICVRAGYHCAPFVHDFIESKELRGTVRISLSYFSSKKEIDVLIHSLEEIKDEL